MRAKLQDVLQKYRSHPEFLGLALDNPNQRGAVDDSPLHIAARKGEIEDLEVMLGHGGDANIVGDLGNTPLHQAAMSGRAAAVALLLKHGAKPSIKNEFDQTALDTARLGNHAGVVAILESVKS